MQISVDGVNPSKVTAKTLKPLRKKLELLAGKATFQENMSGVNVSAPAEEALEVVDFAKAHGFTPRILLVHDENGQSRLSHEELIVYDEASPDWRPRERGFRLPGEDDRVRRSAVQVPLGLSLSLRGRVRGRALVLSDAGRFLERPARIHLRGPSGAVRRAEELQYALHHRLRANRLRDGRVALPVGPRRRASCGDCFI